MAFLKFRQAFCFGALCGTAFWALTQSYSDGTEDYWSCSNVAFALMTLHGMFGFWKYGRTTSNSRIPKFYKPLSLLSTIYTIPLICVDMYLFNYFTFEVAYMHLVYPFVALFSCLRRKKHNCKSIDFVNFVSLTSLSFVSAMSKNYFGLAAAVIHALANYVVRKSGKILGVHCRELENFLMAVFVYLALRSLVAAEKNWVDGESDSCCFPFSLGSITKQLKESLPGVYINSLKIGSSLVQDVENGYFMHPDKQVEYVCKAINEDPKLANGYNAIGFSQGGQFLRAIAQKCPSPPMKNLISLGGQHQGVYGLPNCGSLSHPACDYIRKLLNHAAYLKWVQQYLVQATYWHDPLNEGLYKNASTFLSDINNELVRNETYVSNLMKLENFVLVRFENDTVVQPVDTEWFGFYKPGQAKETQTLEESKLYLEDRLGLRQMNNAGKLKFLSSSGNHLQFNWPWFMQNIVWKYLAPQDAVPKIESFDDNEWFF